MTIILCHNQPVINTHFPLRGLLVGDARNFLASLTIMDWWTGWHLRRSMLNSYWSSSTSLTHWINISVQKGGFRASLARSQKVGVTWLVFYPTYYRSENALDLPPWAETQFHTRVHLDTLGRPSCLDHAAPNKSMYHPPIQKSEVSKLFESSLLKARSDVLFPRSNARQ